jgi:hypothetical protein
MDSRVEEFETRAFGFIEEELAELRFTVSSEGFCKATVIVPGRLPQNRMTRLPTLSSALSPGCSPAASVGPGAQRF